MSYKSQKPKRLVLIDAHAVLHRAYHALPEFSSPKGEPTGALYGLSAMLIKLILDLKPDYIVACYDMPGPTFRHEVYEAYKAKRPKTEDDLIHQMNRSRDIFRAFNVPVYEKSGYEADDIIGTVVSSMKKELKDKKIEIIIASGDMDTMQLIEGERVRVYTLKKGINDTILYDESAVKERFGFSPELLTDFKGLRGDPSDNIIGIVGIGEKTATTLIQAFGTIEEIYKKLKKDTTVFEKKGIKARIINLLKEGEEEALFSKTLAVIKKDVPISFSLPKGEWKEMLEFKKIAELFGELNFRTLLDRAKRSLGVEEKNEENKETDEKFVSFNVNEFEKTKIALWVINSDMTNPTLEEIYEYTNTTSLKEAMSALLLRIKKEKLETVYRDIELPLISILARMHKLGILVDKAHIKNLSHTYHKELEKIQKMIWSEVGGEFNINSPKQLGEVLFDKLMLSTKGLKKTQGGARSTRESELEKLRDGHPVIGKILSYRELQKLLSTYIDNLPKMIESDGRLHTTFIQTGTTTGRMSSVNPNLQNIPIKGERGPEIRNMFIAEKGHVLVAFDYSQIELRVFAMLSHDKDFVSIFKEGRDVHAAVAAEVFGVSQDKVTHEMRRRAKIINFGILYGMGVTSLKRTLGGSLEEARVFYGSYFKEFEGIARYIELIKKEAARKGYTETLFGRRRYFEGFRSHIPYVRASAERMAVNAPVQGSAADIIKFAMNGAERALKKSGFLENAHLLLQVHDELVYEIKKGQEEKTIPVITRAMEEVLNIRKEINSAGVPLEVDCKVGPSWGEMKSYKFQH